MSGILIGWNALQFQNLKELQQKNARIIIADVYDERSEIIMCEAYKLKVNKIFKK